MNNNKDICAALAAEPVFAASEPSDEDLADLSEVFNGDPLPAMRRALELWGRPTIAALAAEPPAPSDPLLGFAATLAASQRPMDPEVAAALTPEARWGLYDGAPAPAADGDREELAALIEQTANSHNGLWPGPIIGKLYRAAALLRQPAPAPVPVPVADRPWERPGWCDTEGRCWWGRCADEVFNPEWALAPHADIKEFCSDAMPQHCLPHWAIPQPPQGGEVEE